MLSLDGGGIRGIITAQILTLLEDKINEQYEKRYNEKPERPLRIAQFFNFIAGTSTGGILTCALLMPDKEDPHYPRFSAQEALDLYLLHGQAIFSKSFRSKMPLGTIFFTPKYPGENIETVLLDKFEDTRISELIRPCLITSYDIEKRRAVFFTQHDASTKGAMYDFLVRDVARSTSAAPTYFPPARAQSKSTLIYHTIDGGLFANNPTMCAVIEALKIFGNPATGSLLDPSRMFIFSLGTGNVDKQYAYKKAKSWGLVNWVAPIIDIMMSAVSETVDYQLRKLYDSIGKSDQYIRIMPELFTADSEMDNVSAGNLEALRQAGLANAMNHEEKLDRIASLLLDSQEEPTDNL